jgi:hypothetical protein
VKLSLPSYLLLVITFYLEGRLKNLANLVLLVIMCGAVYSLIAVGEPFHEMVPAIVCGVLLSARLGLVRFVHTQKLKEEKETHGVRSKKTQ